MNLNETHPPLSTSLDFPSPSSTPRGGSKVEKALWALNLPGRAYQRLQLSFAKHGSLAGHPRWALRMSRWLPLVEYDAERFFQVDGASPALAAQRKDGFFRLAERLRSRAPKTLEATEALSGSVSDVDFVDAYRVPFQFRRQVQRHLKVGIFADRSSGSLLRDLDGNWSYDLGGSYGVNVFGYDFYKTCLERAAEKVRELGPVLGPYHPLLADNIQRLKALSGMDEVSFHMSGTEAVMQAVRLARYHSGKSHVVRFCGAYHGWWDGVQAGPGNPRPAREVYTLREMDERSLRVLDTRRDIACVLVNPLQAMNPNGSPPSDSTLLASDRRAAFDAKGYRRWLKALREVCSRRGIALCFDEVFLGFRLARGGAQEYFGVRADLVTYGKTLGGGLPVGALCGKHAWMRRFKDDRPADVCFARGTFNSHPYVMAAMNEFLQHLDRPEVKDSYPIMDAQWSQRALELNQRLQAEQLPVQVVNLSSVWTTLFVEPGRYNWMFQYYLRDQGLSVPWIGTGRFIFPHNLPDEDFEQVAVRFIAAAKTMKQDGWWAQSGLTNSGIKRQALRELVAARFGRTASGRSALP